MFFDEKGEPIAPLPGYKTPQQLELYLILFLDNTHEKITPKEVWKAYRKDFKYEFKS